MPGVHAPRLSFPTRRPRWASSSRIPQSCTFLHVFAYSEGMKRPMLILIAGPYRSGTDGDPARIAANLERLEEAAAPIHRLGHVPMIGEWAALPILRGMSEQETAVGDVMYETASRL